jgi:hypothetical protein
MKNPSTPEEWQEAVDIAHTMLAVTAARQYGLITGGPEVDEERCLDLLEKGEKKGIRPSPDAIEKVLSAFYGQATIDVVKQADEHAKK